MEQTPAFLNYSKASGIMGVMIREASRTKEIREKALRLTSQLGSGYYEKEAKALFYFVRDKIRYTGDVFGEDVFQLPSTTMKFAAGDCNNRVVLFCSLARSIGFNTAMVFVFEKDSRKGFEFMEFPVHVYAQVELGKSEGRAPVWIDCELSPMPDAWGMPRVFLKWGQKFEFGHHEIVEVG